MERSLVIKGLKEHLRDDFFIVENRHGKKVLNVFKHGVFELEGIGYESCDGQSNGEKLIKYSDIKNITQEVIENKDCLLVRFKNAVLVLGLKLNRLNIDFAENIV
jgi:hypothetical protein